MEATQTPQHPEFTLFEGPTYRKMPELIASGFVPASAAQIMHGCLDSKLEWDAFYDSGDAVVYHPDGRVKLVSNSQDLRRLNQGSMLSEGALVLQNSAWYSFAGEVLTRNDIATYADGRMLSKDDVKRNPVWQWFVRHDMALLSAYADQMFVRMKEHYGYDEAMGIYIGDPQTIMVVQPWRLGGSDVGGFSGSGDLNSNGRLAGIEASRAENETF